MPLPTSLGFINAIFCFNQYSVDVVGIFRNARLYRYYLQIHYPHHLFHILTVSPHQFYNRPSFNCIPEPKFIHPRIDSIYIICFINYFLVYEAVNMRPCSKAITPVMLIIIRFRSKISSRYRSD